MGITSVANSSVVSTAVVKPVIQSDIIVANESTISTVKDTSNKQNTGATANQLSANQLKSITEELNKFMQSINTDIKFELHTKTNTLMIQVEDNKTHKVLKEVPSHQMLDMIARIGDCIGVFFDKKV